MEIKSGVLNSESDLKRGLKEGQWGTSRDLGSQVEGRQTTIAVATLLNIYRDKFQLSFM